MRSLQLQAALTEFVEAAAAHLHAEVAAGAEVPFELEQQSRRRRSSGQRVGGAFYAYRPLTGEFIAEREAALERLPGHAEAARLLAGFDGLDRYLVSVGADPTRADARTRVRAAIGALLRDVFAEQTDFQLQPERLRAALEGLERSALSCTSEVTLVATLHGLTITSAELPLTKGLTIARPHALEGLPAAAACAGEEEASGHLVVVLAVEEDDPREALARGGEVLKDLLRALRLFGDGRVTLGALAWTRVGGGAWSSVALGTGGRPRGMLVVTAEQEDELRAFCNLVSRRAPHGNELAWALRRFELGCERESCLEGLTDHLLALRALLEPEGPSSGLLPGRLAALCATSEHRVALTERTVAALALERGFVIGEAAPRGERRSKAGRQKPQQELANEMADHLRALLRDVICGHLDTNLAGFADQLLLAPAAQSHEQAPEQASAEEVLSDPGQAQEILDVFI
jgi:hypothetical protein